MEYAFANGLLEALTAPVARQGRGANHVSWTVRAQGTVDAQEKACVCAVEGTWEPTALNEYALLVRGPALVLLACSKTPGIAPHVRRIRMPRRPA